MAPAPVYTFGPFRLDSEHRRLELDGQPVVLTSRQFDILLCLVTRAGDLVGKGDLVSAGWKDVAVTDNSLAQVVSSLRQILGSGIDDRACIETIARRGYRFTPDVTVAVPRAGEATLASRLEPYRAFVEGRAAIETLDRDAVSTAIQAFEHVLSSNPDYASAHIGLANAYALRFDTSRFSIEPDIVALERAVFHAREACRIDPDSGEPWATLGFVLSRAGLGVDAVAACRRAITLDPGNWRHRIRLAYAAWGDERLRAARDALQRLPGLGLAHWFAATVHVARQAFDEAARELVAGAAAQDAQQVGGRFGVVGLHLLLGLVRHAQGDTAGAEREIAREIAGETGHIYSAQARATAWYATGAMHLSAGDTDRAEAAFAQAVELAPGHPMALAALAGLARGSKSKWSVRLRDCTARMEQRGTLVDAAAALAVVDVLNDRPAVAAGRVLAALARESEGSSAGWGIPTDPMLQTWRDRDAWQVVLATLRGRAA